MLDKATITHKANQLLAELRANPDWAIDEKNFKQGYLKALEWVLSDTGCLLYTSPSPRDVEESRMPSSA